jgi:hypothetical protein
MIDLMSIVFGKDPATNEGRIAADLMASYQKHRALEEGVDWLVDTEDETLNREDKRLGIAMKRRALGLPMTSDDYERAQNEGRPYATSMTTLAGRHVSQLIPEMTPGAAAGAKMPWASSAPAMERGVINALTGIGGKYAGGIRRLGRLFG